MSRKPETKFDRVKTLAKRWDVHERTVRRLIDSGALRAHTIGSQKRISPEDREAYERQHRT